MKTNKILMPNGTEIKEGVLIIRDGKVIHDGNVIPDIKIKPVN